MRIVFLGKYNPSEILTGPEKVARRIFSGMSKENDSEFIEYFFDGRRFGILKKLFGKETISGPDGLKVLRLGLFTLIVYLFKFKPDLVHLITYERFYFVSFIYKLFSRAKFIYNVHGIIIHENKKYKKAGGYYVWKDKVCECVYLKFSDSLVFLSDESIDIASIYFRLDKKKINILPNGIDEIFHLKGIEKQYGEFKTLKIVFTGNINRMEKGFDFLKKVLENTRILFEVYLVSNGDLKIDNRFIPVTHMDTNSFAEFLTDKDIFISASEYEPFSISAAEAMAAGVVPVVTRQTGMSKYILDGENGLLFDFSNDDELLNILIRIDLNKQSIRDMSLNSIKIYDQISWDNVCVMYYDLYSRLLSKN